MSLRIATAFLEVPRGSLIGLVLAAFLLSCEIRILSGKKEDCGDLFSPGNVYNHSSSLSVSR